MATQALRLKRRTFAQWIRRLGRLCVHRASIVRIHEPYLLTLRVARAVVCTLLMADQAVVLRHDTGSTWDVFAVAIKLRRNDRPGYGALL